MGFEIADARGLGADYAGDLVVYLEAGPNPITAEAWANYTPDPGWLLNTPRQPHFDVLNVLGSPYRPTGEFTFHTDQSGFTWMSVAAVQNRVYPFDPNDYASLSPPLTTSAQAGYALATPLPGTIQYNSNDKNHENIHYAEHADGSRKLQHYVTDPWGNVYILKSVNSANDTAEKVAAAVDAAVLPEGWEKSSGYLDQNVSYLPIYSGNLSHANEFRDSADSAWMQIGWGRSGITLPAVVGEGMPIWGGSDSGLVLGTVRDDLIHGGGGDDRVEGGLGSDTLWGDAGSDTLIGGAGDDRLIGGEGRDVAYFAAAHTPGLGLVERSQGSVLVEGADTLEGVEILVFSNGTSVVTRDSALDPAGFDESAYLASNPDVAAAVQGGVFASAHDHYQRVGYAEGRAGAPDPAVDQAYYLEVNADVAAAVQAGQFASALDHFIRIGRAEGRDPTPLFDSGFYLTSNPDVAAAVAGGGIASAYDHYQSFGAGEGRSASPYFDTARYGEANPDVVAAGMNALDHFLTFGLFEGRTGYLTDDWGG